jgi:hypothetical protein
MTERAGTRILFPPYYLPPTAIVLAAFPFDEIGINCNEKWQKKSCRNHSNIAGPNGLQTLTIPLEKGRRAGLTRDIKISYSQSWQRVHLGALLAAYNSSPFFPYFKDDLFALYYKRPVFLLDFNLELIQFLFERLGISGKLKVIDKPEELPSPSLESDSDELNHPIPAPYPQVFSQRHGFLPNVSIIDLIANQGRIKVGSGKPFLA